MVQRKGQARFVCDLDRVAVDCDKRFGLAAREHEKGTAEYWQAALDPQRMLEMDQPAPGAVDLLRQVAELYALCYVTSRPIACHTSTVTFLSQYGYPNADQVICRPVMKGLTTLRFKQKTVRALSHGLSPALINRHFQIATHSLVFFFLSLWRKITRSAQKIVFVDDSDKNRQAILQLGLENLSVQASLDEVMETVAGGKA